MMTGKHFLIIGGTRGIGKYLVDILLADGSNRVSIFGRNPTHQHTQDRVKEYAADVSDNENLSQSISDAVKNLGKINAVIFMQRHRSKFDEMEKDLEVAVMSTKHVIDLLVRDNLLAVNGNRSIVLVSSIADQYIAEEQPAGYHVAKAGLVQLGRYYALKLGPLGINVNIVSPCVVAKPEAAEYYKNNQPLVDRFKKFIPMGRMGTPEDISNAIIFLTDAKASYITGQNIVVDGGLTLRSHESLLREIV